MSNKKLGRLDSLDAFRGLTIAGMILVNNPGSWQYVYAPLRHAGWHGWKPQWIFAVRSALHFSLDCSFDPILPSPYLY